MPGGRSRDIYLDANATTRVLPKAARAAQDAMEELFGNPSSSHITGLRARFLLESTRSLVRAVLGAGSGRLIFTSGATEAIQTAIFSVLYQLRKTRGGTPPEPPGRVLLYAATEHKAVPQALAHWNEVLGIGDQVLAIPVDRRGQIDLEFLREHAAAADLVCTMAVNNETGVISDLARIEATLRAQNTTVAWMVDCVQAIGKVKLDLSRTTIDYAPISGHKLHAPKGIGVLYVRHGAPLTPLIAGGGQENGARSGTENLPAVAGLAAVFGAIQNDQASAFRPADVLAEYRERLVGSLRTAFPAIVFNMPIDNSVPTTINFSVKGFTSKELLDLFDAAGIRVSSGSACGSALQGSYVLDAMGMPRWRSEGAIRMSFGLTTTDDEIETACERIEEAGRALEESCLVNSDDLHVIPGALHGLVQLKKGALCTWVLIDANSRNCVVIDPVEGLAERIENLIQCQHGRVLAILDTHQHFDHDSCREMLLRVLGDCVLDSARSADALGWPTHADGTAQLGDGSRGEYLRLGGDEVLVRTRLPGHTQDAVAYLVGRLSERNQLEPQAVRFLFSGDTIQIGGLGRSDFPTSSVADFHESLRRLPQLVAESTLICPTHDYANGFATTLAAERRANPLLAQVLDAANPLAPAEFTARKAELDARLGEGTSTDLVCGVSEPIAHESSIDIRPDQWQEFFTRHAESLIVDVREPHEHRFAQNWAALGMRQPPRNVPLTRFCNFLQELLEPTSGTARQDIILVCRSGNRSGKAADVLRRLGIANAWHIAGGIALGVRDAAVAAEPDDFEYSI